MLPILRYRDEITRLFAERGMLIVTAPPGAGKSTQVPLLFLDRCTPEKKLLVLEPRRVAAQSLACRVAEELGEPAGATAGYQVRFERSVSERTKLLFLTYGTFLQLLHDDPRCAGSSIIMFDEFHERSLDADVALAWVRSLKRKNRGDPGVMVLSATLDHGPLIEYLGGCPHLAVPDQAHPVDVRYQEPKPRELLSHQVERAFIGLSALPETGSVLVFLPGSYEIDRAADVLEERCRRRGFRLLKLHGSMPLIDQRQVLRLPAEEPCVILSTNVAETSLTIPGVTTVIDSGLARTAAYDAERGRNTLYVGRISLQNAAQRAGRAGRLTKGICVRLWDRRDEASMPAAIEPEVLRLDLARSMLTLCALAEKRTPGNDAAHPAHFMGSPGHSATPQLRSMECGAGSLNLKEISWLTPPPEDRWNRAAEELARCGAIPIEHQEQVVISPPRRQVLSSEISGRPKGGGPHEARQYLPAEGTTNKDGTRVFPLTDLGRKMCRLPVDPRIAAVVLHGSLPQAREINLAMASLWESHETRVAESTDLFKLAGAFCAGPKDAAWGRDARRTFEQLDKMIAGKGAAATAAQATADLRKEVSIAWTRVFSDRIAFRDGEGSLYTLPDNRSGRLIVTKEGASVQGLPRLICALMVHEQAGRERAKKTVIPLYLPLEPSWVAEAFPGTLQIGVECRWDEMRQRVAPERVTKFKGAVIERVEEPNDGPYRDQIASCLAHKLAQGSWDWKSDEPAAARYACRVQQTAAAYPEMKIPTMTETDWELIFNGLCEGRRSLDEVRKTSVIAAIRSYIGGRLAEFVEKKAPEIIVLPSGRKGKVLWSENAPPELSARIGDFVGHGARFTLMDGRLQGVFNILAPNFRTVQKTADLGSFWKNTYPAIKSELKRKYPRHPWP